MDQREIIARDREWLANVYRGDKDPQPTVRTIVLGTLLGALMSLSNPYVGLKIGWVLGVAITSSILAFGIMSILRKVGLAKTAFTVLENNTMACVLFTAIYHTFAS